MKKLPIILILCLFSASVGFSQAYWRESLDTVSSSGYYNIELSQEMAGLGLHTLKLRDTQGNEIPYLLRASVPVKEMKRMQMYELLSDLKRDSTNTIILRNDNADVSRFYIRMKEAEVAKYIGIRGSNDLKQWFSVKQRSPLRSEHNPSMGGVAIVDFPKGDYAYYELTVTNSSRSPLDIAGVGKIESSTIYGQFVELDTGRFEVTEEAGNSVISFPSIRQPYYLSKLEVDANGKGHFSRRISIERQGSTGKSFELSSRQERPVFYIDDLLIDGDTELVIENGNNPPLTISDVKLYGLNRYLCAYLDARIGYRIETSDDKPRYYDIQGFADEIPLNLPVIKTGKTEEVIIEEPQRILKFYERPIFMWGIIILTGIILLFICARMLKDLKERQD